MNLRRRFSAVESPLCPEKADFTICCTEFTKITSLNYTGAVIFHTTDHFCVPGGLEGHLSALRDADHPDHPPAKAQVGSQLASNEPKAKTFCRGIAPVS